VLRGGVGLFVRGRARGTRAEAGRGVEIGSVQSERKERCNELVAPPPAACFSPGPRSLPIQGRVKPIRTQHLAGLF
jgi:hypothetical protein